MLGWPGTPTTDVTRPPPTAGPRLRNLMFSKISWVFFSDVEGVPVEEVSEVCAIKARLKLATKTITNNEASLDTFEYILIFPRNRLFISAGVRRKSHHKTIDYRFGSVFPKSSTPKLSLFPPLHPEGRRTKGIRPDRGNSQSTFS